MANSVRQAMLSDIGKLLDLMAEFYREAGYSLNRQLSQQALAELLHSPSLGQVWLLEQDGRVGGYIVLTIGFSMEYGGRDAFVDDLFVLPGFRGRGLGRCGLDALLAECRRRNVRAVHLEVGRTNKRAKKLYSKFGFRENNRRLLTCRLTEETTAIEA